MKYLKTPVLTLFLAASQTGLTVQAQTAAPADNAAKPAAVAAAAEDLRPELQQLLPASRLLGKTRLTVWGFQVYDARLWVTPAFSAAKPASHPFALELSYLRDFTNIDIAERSIKEMRRSANITEEQAKSWMNDMLRVVPNVKKGDRIMGVHRPGEGALFVVNGKPSGEIKDTEFAALFFGIWLSPKTSEPQMRSALLAGAL